MPQSIRLSDFRGGLNEGVDTEINDNELSEAVNVNYDDQGILQRRGGSVLVGNTTGSNAVRSQFVLYRANGEAYHVRTTGTIIQRRVFFLHDCETFNGNGTWVASEDANTVATDAVTFQQGAGSVKFNITVASDPANRATLTNSTMTARDLSDFYNLGTGTYGKIRFRAYIPSVVDFTSITIDWGNDASNYFSQTMTTNQAGGALSGAAWNLMEANWATATQTGTVDVTAVNFLRIRFNYAAGYLDQVDCRIDDIFVIHPTVALGDTWDSIGTGLTTGLRFTAVTFRDILHMVNGTDQMRTWDGLAASVSSSANPPLAKYIFLLNGRCFLAGLASPNQSQIVYTNTLPANLTAGGVFGNSQEFDPNDGSIVTGFAKIDRLLAVFKRRKIMLFDPNSSPAEVRTIDPTRGAVDQYSIVNVEDDIYFASDDGIYSVIQREGTDERFKAVPISIKVKVSYGFVNKKNEISAAYHDYRIHFAITRSSQTNTEVLVLDTRYGAFTKYRNITADSWVKIRDASGAEQLYYGSSSTGKVFWLYDGESDEGLAFTSYFATKNFNFGVFDVYKIMRAMAVEGFAALTSIFSLKIYFDSASSPSLTKTINNITATSGQIGVVGQDVVGTGVVGGSSQTTTPQYFFLRRRQFLRNATNIKIRFENGQAGTPWKFLALTLLATLRGAGYTKTTENQ